MNRTVWKYAVNGSRHTFLLPEGAKIVHFGHDAQGARSMWVEVEPSPGLPKNECTVQVYPTGGDIQPGHKHIQTCVDPQGFVWHLYAVPNQ